MRYKLLFVVALLFIYASNCEDDEAPYEPFNHEAQEIIDRDSLQTYMQTHFIDNEGLLQEITGSETPVSELIETINVSHKHYGGSEYEVEVDYEIYYLKLQEGIGISPTVVDHIGVSYKGMELDHEVFDQNDFNFETYLYNTIPGWKYAVPYFKDGISTELADGSFEYSENGKGILFIPSGLAYAEVGTASIPSSSPLIFYIALNKTFRTDHDEDGILSMYEDVNNDGEYTDDTDEDNIINYIDADDDGDGTLTKDENPDPNGDGNPDDALDSDGDGTPDYLDADTH